jgi:hypothetical protein
MTMQIVFDLTVYLFLVAAVSWIAHLALRAEAQDAAKRAQTALRNARHDGANANPGPVSDSNTISGTAEA